MASVAEAVCLPDTLDHIGIARFYRYSRRAPRGLPSELNPIYSQANNYTVTQRAGLCDDIRLVWLRVQKHGQSDGLASLQRRFGSRRIHICGDWSHYENVSPVHGCYTFRRRSRKPRGLTPRYFTQKATLWWNSGCCQRM
jgi:hypothetical protein